MWVNIYDQRLLLELSLGCWSHIFVVCWSWSCVRCAVALIIMWFVALVVAVVVVAVAVDQIKAKWLVRCNQRNMQFWSLLYTCHLATWPLAALATCRSHRACANGMWHREQLPPSLSMCRWYCWLPWEEFDECARYLTRWYHRTVSANFSNHILTLLIPNIFFSLLFLQTPGAKFHNGAASKVLFKLSTIATHWSVQQ